MSRWWEFLHGLIATLYTWAFHVVIAPIITLHALFGMLFSMVWFLLYVGEGYTRKEVVGQIGKNYWTWFKRQLSNWFPAIPPLEPKDAPKPQVLTVAEVMGLLAQLEQEFEKQVKQMQDEDGKPASGPTLH